MQLSSELLAELSEWVEGAARDYFQARWLFMAPREDVSAGVGYFLQQAVERVEKAFLIFHMTRFRFVHDMVELGKQCSEIDPELAPFLSETGILSHFAGKGRYRAGSSGHTKSETASLFSISEKAIEAILARLPAEVAQKYRQYSAETAQYLK